MTDHSSLRLALPSKGELEDSSLALLANAGLKVRRTNPRQYTATIPAVPQVEVLFQRAADIVAKVDEGSVDLGITGFDLVAEQGMGRDHIEVLYADLGFGHCELVLAVPDNWYDVAHLEDLSELSVLFRDQGRDFRIATKYPNLTKTWLYERGLTHFSLVGAQGALEAAPGMGYADLIVDITTSGTTLRENHLKRIAGGTLLRSQACLIGNRSSLEGASEKLQVVRVILELIEAHLRAKRYVSITANLRGDSPEAIARSLLRERALAGLRGPSICRVFSKAGDAQDWYSVTVVVDQEKLVDVVDHLRRNGGTDITVLSPGYLFDEKSWRFEALAERLRRS